MRKVICLVALAAISYGSMAAHKVEGTVKTTMAADTVVKKKVKQKNMKTKVKVKKTVRDTTKTKM